MQLSCTVLAYTCKILFIPPSSALSSHNPCILILFFVHPPFPSLHLVLFPFPPPPHLLHTSCPLILSCSTPDLLHPCRLIEVMLLVDSHRRASLDQVAGHMWLKGEEEEEHVPLPAISDVNEIPQEELEVILSRMNQGGYGSMENILKYVLIHNIHRMCLHGAISTQCSVGPVCVPMELSQPSVVLSSVCPH